MLVVFRVEQRLNGQIPLRHLQFFQQLLGPHDRNAIGMNFGNQRTGGMHEALPKLPKCPHIKRFSRRTLHNIPGAGNLPDFVGNTTEKPRGRKPARIFGAWKRIVFQCDQLPRRVMQPPKLQVDMRSRSIANTKPTAIPVRSLWLEPSRHVEKGGSGGMRA